MSPIPDCHDYYSILEIDPCADLAAIKAAYKRLALAKHPDRNKKPHATQEFQLLGKAYETLSDVDKRREYDVAYESIILPAAIKKRRIGQLNSRLQEIEHERLETETRLRNEEKDLIRLYAEMDSLKGQRECLAKEKAAAESWWPYIWSLAPGKATEYTRQKERRDRDMVNLIGKQRTKELNIHLKSKEVQTLKQIIRSLSSARDDIKEKMSWIEMGIVSYNIIGKPWAGGTR